jgi:hypothetical protein
VEDATLSRRALRERCASTASPVGVPAAVLTAVLLLLGVAACGDDDAAAGPLIVEAGYVDVQLPDGLVRPAGTATTAVGAAAADEDLAASTTEPPESTIPLVESDEPATSKLLKALAVFNGCLEDEGVEFIGAPSPDNPATQDPAYVESLSTCAARSNIVQALQEAQAENDDLSPAEIQERNESYLLWRDCMIDRGWGIPEPTPDAQGRLFSFSQQGGGFEPPPGESLIDSEDLSACADQAQRALGAG